MACGLVLLASGQAIAVSYSSLSPITSAADFTVGSKWSTSCGGAQVGGTITTAGNNFYICDGTSLTLAATDVVNFSTLIFYSTGTWTSSGVLKLSSGSKMILNYNSSLSSIALNVSSMTSGNRIRILGGGGAQSVTFSSVTGGSLACPVGTPYTAGNPIAPNTICTVTVVPSSGIVNAPIDLHFSKQVETFATEIELK